MQIPNIIAIDRLRRGHCIRCGTWSGEGPFCGQCANSASAARAYRVLFVDLIERKKITLIGDAEFGTLDIADSHGPARLTGIGENVDVVA